MKILILLIIGYAILFKIIRKKSISIAKKIQKHENDKY